MRSRRGCARFRQSGLQAALVAIDPQTGDVLALVGGRDFARTPFNRAVNAKRQPGSAFKPFAFAAALNNGMSPVSTLSGLNDLRVPGHDEWEVKNASLEARDILTLREALYESNNQAAVRLQTQIGSRPVLRMAEAVGLPRMPDVPSLALGVGEATPLQLTAAYAVFPNGGFAVAPRPIVQVLDDDGYAVFNAEVQRKPVISEAVAYQMVSMLADVVDIGTGAAARSLGVRFPAAGKTGTTDDFKDAWFVGFSSSVVVGRLGRIRSARRHRPRRLRRAICAADLGRFHGTHGAHPQARSRSASRPPSDAVRLCRVSHLRSARDMPDLHRVLQARRCDSRGQVRRPPRAESPPRSSAACSRRSGKGSGESSAARCVCCRKRLEDSSAPASCLMPRRRLREKRCSSPVVGFC